GYLTVLADLNPELVVARKALRGEGTNRHVVERLHDGGGPRITIFGELGPALRITKGIPPLAVRGGKVVVRRVLFGVLVGDLGIRRLVLRLIGRLFGRDLLGRDLGRLFFLLDRLGVLLGHLFLDGLFLRLVGHLFDGLFWLVAGHRLFGDDLLVLRDLFADLDQRAGREVDVPEVLVLSRRVRRVEEKCEERSTHDQHSGQ